MSDTDAFKENARMRGALTEAQQLENLSRGLSLMAEQLDRMERKLSQLQTEIELVRDIARKVRN